MNLKPGQLYKIEWEEPEGEGEPYPQYNTLYKSPNKVKLINRGLPNGTPVLYLESGRLLKSARNCSRWHKIVYGELIGWVYCGLKPVEQSK